jgi:hypothetical protein
MNQQKKILRLLEALDGALTYIEGIAGRDCLGSPTYIRLIQELRECGEDENTKANELAQILKATDEPYLYFDLREVRDTDPDTFRKLAKQFESVNKHFKG